MTLGVGAAASARASAELAVFFDTTALADMGGALFGRDSTAFAMFLAFLNELRLGAGVRGRANAGAAAWAVADLSGNLLEDPARFDIGVGADAAAGVGAGGKAFFRCEIDDPRRMAMTISELATSDLAAEARRLLPDEQHFLVDWSELIAPAATGVVWDLAQSTALGTLAPPEEMAELWDVSAGLGSIFPEYSTGVKVGFFELD